MKQTNRKNDILCMTLDPDLYTHLEKLELIGKIMEKFPQSDFMEVRAQILYSDETISYDLLKRLNLWSK